ncbi:g8282 [Coccomyxa elongata]
MPFTEQQQKTFEATGHVGNVAFKTTPRVGKIEIKQFLERVYGLKVAAIQTVNYEGKKKRRKTGYFLRSGYKKAYVTLKPPSEAAQTP